MKHIILLLALFTAACGSDGGGAAPASKPVVDPGGGPVIESVSLWDGICTSLAGGHHYAKAQYAIYWINIYDSLDECQRDIFPHFLKAAGECQVRASAFTGAYEFCYSTKSTMLNLMVTVETITEAP